MSPNPEPQSSHPCVVTPTELSFSRSLDRSLGGSCTCKAGKYTVIAGKHAALTCEDACAGRACVGWKQTANCGTDPDPGNDAACSAA